MFWGGGYASAAGGVADAGIAAAASITGDYIAQQTQEQTNAANAAMNTSNQNFNAFQANLGRQFSAQQVQQQENFQQQQVLQQQGYNTEMADTTYTRGVANAEAAGINPLLLAGAGGAPAPTSQAMSGNAASASTASAPSMIAMQNPGASFGGLGNQIGSALQAGNLAAQNDLLKAQARKTNTETDTVVPATVANLAAQTQQSEAQAQAAIAQAHYTQGALTEQGWTNVEVNNSITRLNQLSLDIKTATAQAIINGTQSDAAAKAYGLSALRNQSLMHGSNAGKIIDWATYALKPIGSAVGVAKGVGMPGMPVPPGTPTE